MPEGLMPALPQKWIIAIVGRPGTGKTHGALTFPNIQVADFDTKLPRGTSSLPFWNNDFCNAILKRHSRTNTEPRRANIRDAFQLWLTENIDEYGEEQTLFIDSWTMVQNAFDVQTRFDEKLEAITKTQAINKYWFWNQKLEYCRNIIDLLKRGRCRIIISFHEVIERNEDGEPNGRVTPIMDGQFKDQLLGHFTDVWRCVKDPVTPGQLSKSSKEIADSGGSKYFWHMAGKSLVDINCNPDLSTALAKAKLEMIPNNYTEIEKLLS